MMSDDRRPSVDERRKTKDEGAGAKIRSFVHRLSSIVPKSWFQLAIHIGALIPLAVLIWDFMHNHLTVNPIQEATYRTGKTALVLLVLSLACTPASMLFGWKRVIAWRRPLGLYAFMYAALHFLIFTAVDYGLDWGLIWATVLEKRYVVAGFTAFLLLLPLAITSTKGSMRRLGKRWKKLHRLVYVAAILAVVHFVWLVKADIREPLMYGAAVALLLALRLPPVRRKIRAFRARVLPAKRKSARRMPEVSTTPDADSI
jgi:sulfoxide reductase heme-binding subunit YedZ